MSPSCFNPRHLAALSEVKQAGGYLDQPSDAEAAEECAAASWLIAEGETGYALTLTGSDALAQTSATTDQAPQPGVADGSTR